MRARVARILRALATRIDGPQTITVNLPVADWATLRAIGEAATAGLRHQGGS